MNRLVKLQIFSILLAVLIFGGILRTLFINLNDYAAERGLRDAARYTLLFAATTLALLWLIVQVAASLTAIRRFREPDTTESAPPPVNRSD